MKKLITLFGVMMMLAGTAFAQNCNFKVKFKVTAATCYNNGKVHYALVDDNDNPITMPATLGLDSVRIYYKVNEGDSVHYGHFYAGGWDSLVIDYGDYIIGVEGICNCGAACYTKVDTHLVLNIPTTYTRPTVESFSSVATTDNGINTSVGMRPTINCMNTGRLQLNILDGRFPFTVDIVDQATGDTLRTEAIYNRQYSGIDPRVYDYRDYYSFDSLPAGVWEFHIVDGCSYKMPIHTSNVTVVQFPSYTSRFRYPTLSCLTPSDYADEVGNSVFSIELDISKEGLDFLTQNRYDYLLQYFPQLVELRFKYGDDEYGEWKKFSPTPHSGSYFLIYDTIRDMKLCELFGKTVTFQYRDNCNDTTYTQTIQLYDITTYHSSASADPCNKTYGCEITAECTHRTLHRRFSVSSDKWINGYQYQTYIKNAKFNNLKWIYIDILTGDTIKQDTIPTLTTTSYLYDYEFEAIYGSFVDTSITKTIRRVLVSEGCDTLFDHVDDITFSYYRTVRTDYPYWEINKGQGYYDACCKSPRYVDLRGYNYYHRQLPNDSVIVRLVRSPKNNLYNFEAVFLHETETWTYKKEHLENTAWFEGSKNDSYFHLYLKDYCLPSGPYEFEIITPCDTYHLKINASFHDTYETYFVQEPSYVIEEECTNATLTYTSGQVGFHRYNTSPITGNDTIVPDYIPATTRFRIINGPSGGYDNTYHYYKVGEPMPISMKGQYIIRYYYTNNPTSPLILTSNYRLDNEQYSYYFCSNIYDTIDYEPTRTVEFDYAEALLCDPSSTHGTVYVQGSKGSAPYTYTLYRGPDKQGDIIGTNIIGVFENVAMTPLDEFSCSVQDSCGASFYVNIKPKTWSELQKVWFDGGLSVTTTCEGSTICVNALSIGNIMSYEWSGPDGFSDTKSRSCVFIPRGGQEGWYKVHIYHSGCADDYEDSIYLHIDPAPWVDLSPDLTVCPGAPAELKFVPKTDNTTDNISVTMVFESETEKNYQNFTVQPGDTIKHTINPLTHTKVYTELISDGTCSYAIADDTQHVYVHPIDPYTITSVNASVCVKNTANPSAFSSISTPYIIRWYNDYELTDMVKEDTIQADDDPSSITLPNLTQDRIFYLTVENAETCPTTYGFAFHFLNMNNGETTLSLGNTFRFYDSGGQNGNYSANEQLSHTFKSSDGKPVTIKFNDFQFPTNTSLYIFSGSDHNPDSLLYTLTNGSTNPGVITSNGDALTCYFVSASNSSAMGWDAIVEHEPAKVIAAVRPTNEVTIYDTICQSRTREYDDSRYHISPNITSIESLNNVVNVPGIHTFSNTLPGSDRHGCDSIVNFKLVVNHAKRRDTTVLITDIYHEGYPWHDSIYTKSGNYARLFTLSDGCDSLDVLRLVVLTIDTTDIDFCIGDTTEMTVPVTEMKSVRTDSIIPYIVNIGDVLCTDGSVMRPDDYLTSGKTAMGVVFSVDASSGYGRAISLTSYSGYYTWAQTHYKNTHSTPKPTLTQALLDMDGAGNTDEILRTSSVASGTTNTDTYAKAAHYCKFYNHNTNKLGTDSLGWYLPSAGEMALIYDNRVELNSTLYKLSKSLLNNYKHWTSTEFNNNYVWVISDSGELGTEVKNTGCYIRPVILFPLP